MIHRALFGSIERFFGVLIEHYAGAFPLWLAPVQVAVLPITDRINDYAEKVAAELREAPAFVSKRTRNLIRSVRRSATLSCRRSRICSFLGDKELEEQQVAVRERKQGDIGAMSLEEFKEMITRAKAVASL